MRHGLSGCQGVPNRPEFREAATTLRAQCETLDQPAALAAYLNPLLKEAGLTKPTAAHPSGGPVAGGAIGTSGMPLTACGRACWSRSRNGDIARIKNSLRPF